MTFVFLVSSINAEAEFCVRCLESSNRCRRLTYKMMADNSDRNISLCKEIPDGFWTNWTDVGACKGLEKVEGLENYRCGEGHKTVERSCTRNVGGAFCIQDDGTDYRGVSERRSFICYSGDCPGELSSKHFELDNKFK